MFVVICLIPLGTFANTRARMPPARVSAGDKLKIICVHSRIGLERMHARDHLLAYSRAQQAMRECLLIRRANTRAREV